MEFRSRPRLFKGCVRTTKSPKIIRQLGSRTVGIAAMYAYHLKHAATVADPWLVRHKKEPYRRGELIVLDERRGLRTSSATRGRATTARKECPALFQQLLVP
jgi:hypothetical protein